MSQASLMTDEAQFDAFFSEKAARGLCDTKFYVGNVDESTLDSFCKESNEIDRALALGNFVSHQWPKSC